MMYSRSLFSAVCLSFCLSGAITYEAHNTPAQAEELVNYDQLSSGTYALDPTHASILWKVNHLGLSNYTARFTKFDATLSYNAEDPAKSTVSVTIDPLSVETDYPKSEEKDFNKKLAEGKKWFNGTEFSAIKFTSTSLELLTPTTGKLTGDLTFLGTKKPLTLDVTFNGAYTKAPFSDKAKMGFSATGMMKRSEWGFDTYVPAIGDEVELIIEAEFVQQ